MEKLNKEEKLKELFESDIDALIETIRDINNYDGSLDNLDFYDMDSFDELNSGKEPWEIARACYYGNFNPSADMWTYNDYGNFKSMDKWEYEEECKRYINDVIEWVIENGAGDIYNDDVKEILNEEEEDEE